MSGCSAWEDPDTCLALFSPCRNKNFMQSDYFDAINEDTMRNVWYRFPLIWCLVGSGKMPYPRVVLPPRYHKYDTEE